MTSKIGFVYTIEHVDVDGRVISSEEVHNIIPNPALDYIIGSAFKGVSQFSSFYLTLFGTNYTPLSTDTMTTLIAACGELSTYTGSTRPSIVFPAPVNGSIVTTASPNEFNFVGAETVRGAFITSGPTIGGTSGLLVSAVLFPSPKVLSAGDTLRVPVGFALTSS